ncbi:acyltransferase [Methanobrevibacter thaueri]|uniref:Acyltransferase family protein n=1 Tax=Methanobrevibacter thaueri TaxID=190975 RepID=A0A315XPQ8_9EURY|nr:acyltransferase [Methanobrevibacter thaueri]PWB86548.1 acyltransferase family protein [Methanobrevibacter thaueri]
MTNASKRIFYFDALRAFAILCVVLLHVTGHLGEMMSYDIHTIYSFSGFYETFANNFFRIGVDLFLMLSGALLLGRDWDIKGFLSKRIPRIVKPFVFWSAVFTVLLVAASYFIPSVGFVKSFGIMGILRVFWNTLMCKAPGSAVYWFFWMMLGVYLTMPIFNKWIKHAELSELEYFLAIWVITTLFDYTLMIECPVKLSYFISPMGLVVLGYYLRYTERKVFNSRWISWILILLPSIAMLAYSYMVVGTSILFEFHRYSILVIIVAIGVFCLFKTSTALNSIPKSAKGIITSISICSYGMYLIHSQMIMVVRKILHLSFNFTIDYLILFLTGFVLSWIIIYILAKMPILDEFIGVK